MNDKLADTPHIWKPPFRWDDFDGVCRDADNWTVPVRVLTELLIAALRRSQPEGKKAVGMIQDLSCGWCGNVFTHSCPEKEKALNFRRGAT